MNKIFIYARPCEHFFLPGFRVRLALIFSIFPVNFELFIHSYRLTGSNVLAQTKV